MSEEKYEEREMEFVPLSTQSKNLRGRRERQIAV